MAIILFESLLLALALALAVLLRIDLGDYLRITPGAVALGVGAALLPSLALAAVSDTSWLRDLRERTARLMRRVFGPRPGPGAALVVAYGGIAEEVLFRGVLISALGAYIPSWLAVILVGIGFGLLHPVSRLYIVLAALLGIFWGALFVVTGNLLVPMVAHALNNVLALFYYSRSPQR